LHLTRKEARWVPCVFIRVDTAFAPARELQSTLFAYGRNRALIRQGTISTKILVFYREMMARSAGSMVTKRVWETVRSVLTTEGLVFASSRLHWKDRVRISQGKKRDDEAFGDRSRRRHFSRRVESAVCSVPTRLWD